MYGIALPSGADATTAIAIYLCGSEDEFVKLMNRKVEELGLKNTHFTNASGLYDPNHYSTATDIAMLMSAVMENDTCREILGTYQYTTTATEQHPEGILLESTMYSRMYGNEVTGISIDAGKLATLMRQATVWSATPLTPRASILSLSPPKLPLIGEPYSIPLQSMV